jgi:hypothetical protein
MTHYPRISAASTDDFRYDSRAWRFDADKTQARHWTRTSARSVFLRHSQPNLLRLILILFSLLLSLPGGTLHDTSPPKLTAQEVNMHLRREGDYYNCLRHVRPHQRHGFSKLNGSVVNLSLASLFPGGYLVRWWVRLVVSFGPPKNSIWKKQDKGGEVGMRQRCGTE